MIKYSEEVKQLNQKVLNDLALYNVNYTKIEKVLKMPQGLISKSISGKSTCFKYTEKLNNWILENVKK